MVAEFGLSAENLVQKLLKTHEMRNNLQVPVCNRLADQLMLFIAQTSQSEILTGPISNHIKTNAKVINSFLPDSLIVEEQDGGKVRLSS